LVVLLAPKLQVCAKSDVQSAREREGRI
jgi:hypothetical protein